MAKRVFVAKLDPLMLVTDTHDSIELGISYFDLLQDKENLTRFVEVLRLFDDGYLTVSELKSELKKIEDCVNDAKLRRNLKVNLGVICLSAVILLILFLLFVK